MLSNLLPVDSSGRALRSAGTVPSRIDHSRATHPGNDADDFVAPARLRSLVENMTEVFFSYDHIGQRCDFISPACEEMFGYTQQEFRDNPKLWLEIIHPEYRHGLPGSRQLFPEGKRFASEFRIIRKDNTLVWVEAKIVPTLNDNGTLVRTEGSVADISGRKQTELKLQEKMDELNMFTYKASHDLRAPLASMLGLVGIARQEAVVPSVQQYLDLIHSSALKMDELLKDLMSVATVTQGELQAEPIGFRPLIRQTLESIKFLPGFSEVDIAVDVRYHDDFRTDRRLLQSILSNLFSNAIKYRHGARPSALWISAEKDGDMVRITVADNGIGIAKGLQQRVFEMFFRATEQSNGSGLGLYIVKSGVEKLHGRIELSSDMEQGSTFTLRLPSL